ncbi:hypothetical protein HMN09_01175800 [Mycena chlorophos]|uniref:Uncharacterized protein n=1 Tax=Mycena chlorophos TaxID=658473 RepID=A0A8H6S803_MYCCL|nr:hypothetical protein HMN09_01175800 [Mycena chlorophos]
MPAVQQHLRGFLRVVPDILYFCFYIWASYAVSKALLPRIGERIGFDASVLVPPLTGHKILVSLEMSLALLALYAVCTCVYAIAVNRHVLPLLNSSSEEGSTNPDSEKDTPINVPAQTEKGILAPAPPRPMRRDSADGSDEGRESLTAILKSFALGCVFMLAVFWISFYLVGYRNAPHSIEETEIVTVTVTVTPTITQTEYYDEWSAYETMGAGPMTAAPEVTVTSDGSF